MKNVTVLFLLLVLSSVALAEAPGGKRAKMFESLNLTQEQRAQIADIKANGGGRKQINEVLTAEQLEQANKWRKQHGKGSEKRVKHLTKKLDLSEEQALQVKEIIAAGGTGKDIKAVLTDEQRKTFQAMAKKRKGKKKGHMKRQGAASESNDTAAQSDE